jgi:hypothetical protein
MSKKEVVEKKDQLPTLAVQFEQDAGAGFENATAESFAIPFLQVLQSLSPQVKKTDGAYIKGAEEGMLINTVTGELFDGEKGIEVIPVHYRRAFLKWVPREKGGGFLGEMDPNDPTVAQAKRDDRGRDILPDGNQVNDTRIHYVLVVKSDGVVEWAVMSLSSTQIKKSKNWMAKMQAIKMRRADGSIFTPPMFSHRYHLTSVPEKNDKGSWMGWKIETGAQVEDVNLVNAAKAFRDAVVSGEKREDFAQAEPAAHGETDDGVAF